MNAADLLADILTPTDALARGGTSSPTPTPSPVPTSTQPVQSLNQRVMAASPTHDHLLRAMRQKRLAHEQAVVAHAQYLSTLGGPDTNGRETLHRAFAKSSELGVCDVKDFVTATAIGARFEPPISASDALAIYSAAMDSKPLPLAPENVCGYKCAKFSNVPATQCEWMWGERIPVGYLSLLEVAHRAEGNLLVSGLVAAVSRGNQFRPGEPVMKAQVALVITADAAEDTFRPMLEHLEADLSELLLFSCAVTDGRDVELDLARHCANLAAFLRQNPEVKLMVINPLEGFIEACDKTGLRKCVKALAKVAKEQGVAILGVCETGSAVTKEAAKIARMVWGLREDPRIHGRSILYPVKCDLGNAAAVALSLNGDVPVWEDGSVEDPTQVLRGKAIRPIQQATEFLLRFLADGSKPLAEIRAAMEKAKLSLRTMQRAKKALNVQSETIEGVDLWKLADES
jgi:hypothetical protein